MSVEELLLLISKQLNIVIGMLLDKKENAPRKKGRPTKENIVIKYRNSYPNARKMQCARATGLSIKTVSKYWEKGGEKRKNTEIDEHKDREI